MSSYLSDLEELQQSSELYMFIGSHVSPKSISKINLLNKKERLVPVKVDVNSP